MVRSSEFEAGDIDHEKLFKLAKKYFWLDSANLEIDKDGKLNVLTGDVDVRKGSFQQFPFAFGIVKGHFSCDGCGLTSLKGSPTSVGGVFNCGENELDSLVGSPRASSHFVCTFNNLTSLIGAPNYMAGTFNCQDNKLISLEGLPKAIRSKLMLTWQPDLPLLRAVGKHVDFNTRNKTGSVGGNKLNNIFNKYIGEQTRSNILACQKELIDAGFEGNASW